MWASGDYPSMVETFLLPLGPRLVEACEIGPGMRVLDVAAGTGNAAIPAAATGATVVASDLTPELFEAGRARAEAEGVELEWAEADAEDLPFEDASFDVVISSIGVMFAPHHQAAADELVRVCRPGGTIGLLSWTPEGTIGGLFRTIGPFAPTPPPGAQPPPLWGGEDHLRELFGDRVELEKLERDVLEVTAFEQPDRLRRALQAALRADDRGAGQRAAKTSARRSSSRRWTATSRSRTSAAPTTPASRWSTCSRSGGGDHERRGRSSYDAVIVGARCAGSPLATRLAERGWSVLLVDREPPPADTLSTHYVFPNTLSRLRELGALQRIEAQHRLNPLHYAVRVLGEEVTGPFTPVDGFDRMCGVTRPVLDQALLDTAVAAGAETRFGERVIGLLGAGSAEDPVRGVELEGGEQIEARWVLGADGRASTVAGLLGPREAEPGRGRDRHHARLLARPARERQLPGRGARVGVAELGPVRGRHLDPDARRAGGADPRRRRAAPAPLPLEPRPVRVVRPAPARRSRADLPDPRRPRDDAARLLPPGDRSRLGPGRRRRPLQAPRHRPGHLRRDRAIPPRSQRPHQPREDLSAYEAWRDERAREHYEWSFDYSRLPRPDVARPIFAGLASDPEAGQAFRDSFTRLARPRSDVLTPKRLERWFAKAPAGAV